jgi:PAS domain S-box-containing protein
MRRRLWALLIHPVALYTVLASSPTRAEQPWAQPWAAVADPIFYHPTADGDSPRAPVLAIAQDHQGFLWIGTEAGVARWDGYRYRSYRAQPGNGKSLPDNYIQSLHVDAQGVLWIGTLSGGLSRYEPATDRFFNYPAGPGGIGSVDVRAITDDGSGGVWIATNQGLDEVSPARGVIRHLSHDVDPVGLPDDDIRAVLRDSAGRLWIGTRTALVRQDLPGQPLVRVPLESPQGRQASVLRIYEDAEQGIWIGTKQGAYVIPLQASRTGAPLTPVAGSQGEQIMSLMEGRPGQLWLGTYGHGVLVLDVATSATRRIRHDPLIPTSLDEDTLWALFRDRDGAVWLGTNRGFSRHDPRQSAILSIFGVVSRETGLSDGDVEAVLSMPNGQLWAGLGSSGVDILDPIAGRVGHLDRGRDRTGTHHALGEVRGLARTASGVIFLCTRSGLYRKAADDPEPVEVPLPHDGGVRAAAISADGKTLWLGSVTDGLWTLDVDQSVAETRPYGPSAGLTDPRVSVILAEPAGSLWVGTFHGLNHLDPSTGSVERIEAHPMAPDGIAAPYVTSLLVDRGGRLWVATMAGGISILEGRSAGGRPRFRHLGLADGLPDLNVDELLETSAGMIWAATDNGLAVIDPRTFAIHLLGRGEGVEISSYWINAGAVAADGALAFGGAGGMTLVRPAQPQAAEYRTPLVVGDVRVGGRPIPWSPFNRASSQPAIDVEPKSNSVSVEFAALDYASPERVRYAYRLEGFEPSWTEADSEHRVATYTNLPPGAYLLRVRASRDSASTTQSLALPIEVHPAWYQTVWFKLACTLAWVIAAFWGLAFWHRFLVARQQRRERVRHAAILETLTQNLPDTLLLVDRDLSVRFSNRPLTPSRADPVGRPLADAVPADMAAPLAESVLAVMRDRRPSSFECRWQESDGKTRVFEQRAAPVIAENELLGVAMRSTEITERRALEDQLRIQARVLDLMTEGVVVLDRPGRVLLANQAMLSALGVAAAGLVGRLLEDRAVTPADGEALRRVLGAQSPRNEEIRLRRDDGDAVLLALASSPVGIDSIPGIICACRDISVERDVERVVAEAAARDARIFGASLHEGLAQELSGISLYMSDIGRAVRGSKSEGDVRAVRHYIDQAIRTACSLAQQISPTTPARGSLEEALRALAAASAERLAIAVRYRGTVPEEFRHAQLGDQLYRLAADAIRLGAGELGALAIDVETRDHREGLILEIRIETPSLAGNASIASRRVADIVAYRARLMGGWCRRETEAGTEVFTVTIPPVPSARTKSPA